jgi:hypothetical protein
MRVRDVFTPGSFPTVTFVNEHLKEKEQILKDALEVGSTIISLSGPSKSGKTVFVENVIGRESLIHVTGAGVDTPSKLWERVFDFIGTPIEVKKMDEKSFQGTISGKIGGDAGIFVRGKGEVSSSGAWSSKSADTGSYIYDHLQLLIRELRGTDFTLFIDDFHYISKDAKVEIAQQIKEAIRNNVRIICASVPYHSDDAIRANSDLRGRVTGLDFDYWKPEVLAHIARKGFAELNVKYEDIFIDKIIHEAAGSPQLMQSICLNTCLEANIREKGIGLTELPIKPRFLPRVCNRTAMSADYSSIVEKMKEGPKTRGTIRNSYVLKDGSQSDVYAVVLRAIASDPPELTFRYSDLFDRINSLCHSDTPSGSSVTGACYHMSNIANGAANQLIIEWDGDNDVLDILDPYLLFYLRWVEFSKS